MNLVIVGRNSQVWRQLASHPALHGVAITALGHRDVAAWRAAGDEMVWVLSYSREASENDALLQRLHDAGARRIVYVSTATANVVDVTTCYEYPRVKYRAEATVRRLFPTGTVVRIGVVCGDERALPGGTTAATTLTTLATALTTPSMTPAGEQVHLFSMVRRPFSHALDRWAFTAYGVLQRLCGAYPCALRPLDLLLRVCGARWYGYVYLSNRLWLSTTSS